MHHHVEIGRLFLKLETSSMHKLSVLINYEVIRNQLLKSLEKLAESFSFWFNQLPFIDSRLHNLVKTMFGFDESLL